MMAATTVSPRTRRAHVEAPVPRSRPAEPRGDTELESRVESTAPDLERAELRLVRPEPKRTGRAARRAVYIGPALVLLSLLSVAGAQTYLTQGQVRLTALQADIAAAQTKRLDLELQIADEEEPSAVMAAARQLGLVEPSKISDLPAVDLPAPARTGKTKTSQTEGGVEKRNDDASRACALRGARVRSTGRARLAPRRRRDPARTSDKRIRLMRLVVLIAFMALAARLVQVQALSGQHYSSLAAGQVTTVQHVPAVRGGIYDRDGAVLAISVQRSAVIADPFIIHDAESEARELAPVLNQPVATLQSELTEDSGFVYLARLVDDQVSQAVQNLNLQGINILPATQRVYPSSPLASALIGTVGADGSGESGLEYQYDNPSLG